jgi:hypothetical protein
VGFQGVRCKAYIVLSGQAVIANLLKVGMTNVTRSRGVEIVVDRHNYQSFPWTDGPSFFINTLKSDPQMIFISIFLYRVRLLINQVRIFYNVY